MLVHDLPVRMNDVFAIGQFPLLLYANLRWLQPHDQKTFYVTTIDQDMPCACHFSYTTVIYDVADDYIPTLYVLRRTGVPVCV